MQRHLYDVYPDCFTSVTNLLDSFELYRLYATGNARIRVLLSRSVKSIDFSSIVTDGDSLRLSVKSKYPTYWYYFKHVTSLRFLFGCTQHFVIPNYILPNLRHLEVDSYMESHCMYTFQANIDTFQLVIEL